MDSDDRKALGLLALVVGLLTGGAVLFDKATSPRPSNEQKRRASERASAKRTTRLKRRRRQVATPRAFISFDFDHDDDARILFAGQGKKDSPTPFSVADWS